MATTSRGCGSAQISTSAPKLSSDSPTSARCSYGNGRRPCHCSHPSGHRSRRHTQHRCALGLVKEHCRNMAVAIAYSTPTGPPPARSTVIVAHRACEAGDSRSPPARDESTIASSVTRVSRAIPSSCAQSAAAIDDSEPSMSTTTAPAATALTRPSLHREAGRAIHACARSPAWVTPLGGGWLHRLPGLIRRDRDESHLTRVMP